MSRDITLFVQLRDIHSYNSLLPLQTIFQCYFKYNMSDIENTEIPKVPSFPKELFHLRGQDDA